MWLLPPPSLNSPVIKMIIELWTLELERHSIFGAAVIKKKKIEVMRCNEKNWLQNVMDYNAQMDKLTQSYPITEQSRDNYDNGEVNVIWGRSKLINTV